MQDLKFSRVIAAAVAVGLTGGLVACSPSEGDAPDTGDGQLTTVTIGALPLGDIAPLYLGMDQGIFESHGIELDIQFAQGGAAIIPAVVTGDFQFGFSNAVSLLVAAQNDIPIRVISNASTSTNVAGADAVEVLAPAGSDIEGAEDLVGKTVAINALNNFGDIAIRNSVDAAGGDSSAINFVEVPYPNMPAQLAAGEVDAAWVGEPFRTQAINDGATVVASPLTDLGESIDNAYFFTSSQLLESDPELVDNFRAAVQESLEYATENESEARAAISEYSGLDSELAETIVLVTWPSKINRDGLKMLADRAVEYGILNSEPDFDSLIVE